MKAVKHLTLQKVHIMSLLKTDVRGVLYCRILFSIAGVASINSIECKVELDLPGT